MIRNRFGGLPNRFIFAFKAAGPAQNFQCGGQCLLFVQINMRF
jgi:hypothetical protein